MNCEKFFDDFLNPKLAVDTSARFQSEVVDIYQGRDQFKVMFMAKTRFTETQGSRPGESCKFVFGLVLGQETLGNLLFRCRLLLGDRGDTDWGECLIED